MLSTLFTTPLALSPLQLQLQRSCSASWLHGPSARMAERALVEEHWGAVDDWLSRHDEQAARPLSNGHRADPHSWMHVRRSVAGGPQRSFYARQSYAQLGASPQLQSSLAQCGYTRPSTVAAEAFGPVLRGEHNLIAYPSGSGKTVAWLAPLLQRLAEIEARDGRAAAGTARAMVLVPSNELGMQVLEQARDLSGGKIRASIATGVHKWATQRDRLAGGLELLVATLGRLQAHLTAQPPSADVSSTVALVLDEFDTLWEGEELMDAYHNVRSMLSPRCSVTLVTSTLLPTLRARVQRDIPDVRMIEGTGLHRTHPGLVNTLVDCSAHRGILSRRGIGSEPPLEEAFYARMEALALRLKEEPARRTVVVTNNIATCQRVESALKELSIAGASRKRPRIIGFHGQLSPEKRRAALKAFARKIKIGPTARASPPRILVTTDRVARGIDLPGTEHVVLFDFPRDGSEYIRRVGRATRGDCRAIAHVTSLAYNEQVPFAHALLNSDEAGRAIRLEH